jgi:hypoxanthine phosphoribosyltransferase
MQADIQRVLFNRAAIARGVARLARRITADLNNGLAAQTDAQALAGTPGVPPVALSSFEVTLVPILTGSFIFVADLIRRLPLRMKIRLISIGSYPGKATSSRGAMVQSGLTNLPASLAGAHVLVIDDILDSGSTLRLAMQTLRECGPASVRSCVLLRKRRAEALAFPVDYVCFDIPDEFVVGYGLDYNDYYRNLPDIVTLKPEVMAA